MTEQKDHMIRIPSTGKPLDEVEKEAIIATLELTGYHQSRTALILKISRPTLTRKIRKYGIVID